MSDPPQQPEKCSTCEEPLGFSYYMCDRRDGAWCCKCFRNHPCGYGKHGVECATLVIGNRSHD